MQFYGPAGIQTDVFVIYEDKNTSYVGGLYIGEMKPIVLVFCCVVLNHQIIPVGHTQRSSSRCALVNFSDILLWYHAMLKKFSKVFM